MATKKEMDRVWKHIETTNHELGVCQKDIAKIKADVVWLKYIAGLILTAVCGLVFKAFVG